MAPHASCCGPPGLTPRRDSVIIGHWPSLHAAPQTGSILHQEICLRRSSVSSFTVNRQLWEGFRQTAGPLLHTGEGLVCRQGWVRFVRSMQLFFNRVLLFSCTINTVLKNIIVSLLNVFVQLQSGQFTPDSLPEGWEHYWPVCFHGTSRRCQTWAGVCPFRRGWTATSDWLTGRLILTNNCRGGLLGWAENLDLQKVPQLVASKRDLSKNVFQVDEQPRINGESESFRVAAWWRKTIYKMLCGASPQLRSLLLILSVIGASSGCLQDPASAYRFTGTVCRLTYPAAVVCEWNYFRGLFCFVFSPLQLLFLTITLHIGSAAKTNWIATLCADVHTPQPGLWKRLEWDLCTCTWGTCGWLRRCKNGDHKRPLSEMERYRERGSERDVCRFYSFV